METVQQKATGEAVRAAEIKISEKFEEERGSKDNYKEEVEANVESLLESNYVTIKQIGEQQHSIQSTDQKTRGGHQSTYRRYQQIDNGCHSTTDALSKS